jgi:hypothetical protein
MDDAVVPRLLSLYFFLYRSGTTAGTAGATATGGVDWTARGVCFGFFASLLPR